MYIFIYRVEIYCPRMQSNDPELTLRATSDERNLVGRKVGGVAGAGAGNALRRVEAVR